MISYRKVNFTEKRKVAKQLNRDGYISSVELSKMDFNELDSIGIDSKKFDKAEIIKQKFEKDNFLRCKKYWYYLEDLRKVYKH
jgi:hypothetical protein